MESPRSRRWGNATPNANAAKGNAAEPSLGQARHEPTPTPPRRAEGQRQFSHQVGTYLAQAPRRGFGGCKAVGKRERRPKTPRPMGQRPSRDEYGDDSRTKPHRARGYNLLALGGAKPRPRREWDNPLASQPDSLARHNKTTLLHTANDASRITRRIAYRRECDNRTKNTPSTHHQRRPPETTGGRIAAEDRRAID